MDVMIHPKNLLVCIQFFKDSQLTRYKLLSTITCIDFPEMHNRFELIYTLMSIDFPHILNLRFKISEFVNIESISSLYKSSVWLEREVWDMFGIYFLNNLDLRRILTDYGFPYHPLRKTFPLQGFSEINFNFLKKKVNYIPLNLSQEKPNKNVISTWVKLS
jgi:NADH-quinone oxidoreductase subunit C